MKKTAIEVLEEHMKEANGDLTVWQEEWIITAMEDYAQQQVNSVDSADVVNWLPFNEENASHYNRLAKEGKLVKLYDTGEQRHVNDDNFPMAVVTHYREG